MLKRTSLAISKEINDTMVNIDVEITKYFKPISEIFLSEIINEATVIGIIRNTDNMYPFNQYNPYHPLIFIIS